MPSWILVALYLFIGAMISTSFNKDDEAPDYGFVTIVMLFWPIIVVILFVLAIRVIVGTIRGK